jgi:hypothetical protein
MAAEPHTDLSWLTIVLPDRAGGASPAAQRAMGRLRSARCRNTHNPQLVAPGPRLDSLSPSLGGDVIEGGSNAEAVSEGD